MKNEVITKEHMYDNHNNGFRLWSVGGDVCEGNNKIGRKRWERFNFWWENRKMWGTRKDVDEKSPDRQLCDTMWLSKDVRNSSISHDLWRMFNKMNREITAEKELKNKKVGYFGSIFISSWQSLQDDDDDGSMAGIGWRRLGIDSYK